MGKRRKNLFKRIVCFLFAFVILSSVFIKTPIDSYASPKQIIWYDGDNVPGSATFMQGMNAYESYNPLGDGNVDTTTSWTAEQVYDYGLEKLYEEHPELKDNDSYLIAGSASDAEKWLYERIKEESIYKDYFNGIGDIYNSTVVTINLENTILELLSKKNGLTEDECRDILSTNYNYLKSYFRSFRKALKEDSSALKNDSYGKTALLNFISNNANNKNFYYGLILAGLKDGLPVGIFDNFVNGTIDETLSIDSYMQKKFKAWEDGDDTGYYFLSKAIESMENSYNTGLYDTGKSWITDTFHIFGLNFNIFVRDTYSKNNFSLLFFVGKTIAKVLDLGVDSVTENTINSFVSMFFNTLIELIDSMSEQLGDFRPTLKMYYHYFGIDVDDTDTPIVAEGSGTIVDLNKFFTVVGYTFAIFLLLLNVLTAIVFANDKDKVTVSPQMSIVLFTIAIVLIYASDQVGAFIFQTADSLWSSTVESWRVWGNERQIFVILTSLFTFDFFDISWHYVSIGALFNAMVGFVIAKNVFMLLLECIERYVVSTTIRVAFPTASSTVASPKTVRVFSSYMSMLLSSIFMLFMNMYFIYGFLLLCKNIDVWGKSLYGVFFVLAYLKTAQKIDSHMSSLGLNVAQTGGRLFSDAASAIGGVVGGTMLLAKGVRMAGNIANSGARATGKAMQWGATRFGGNGRNSQVLFAKGKGLENRGLAGVFGSHVTGREINEMNSRRLALKKNGGVSSASAFNAMIGSAIPKAQANQLLSTTDGLRQTKKHLGSFGDSVQSAQLAKIGNGLDTTTKMTVQGQNVFGKSTFASSPGEIARTKGMSTARYTGLDNDAKWMSYSTHNKVAGMHKLEARTSSDGHFIPTTTEIALGFDSSTFSKDALANTYGLLGPNSNVEVGWNEFGRLQVAHNGEIIGTINDNGVFLRNVTADNMIPSEKLMDVANNELGLNGARLMSDREFNSSYPELASNAVEAVNSGKLTVAEIQNDAVITEKDFEYANNDYANMLNDMIQKMQNEQALQEIYQDTMRTQYPYYLSANMDPSIPTDYDSFGVPDAGMDIFASADTLEDQNFTNKFINNLSQNPSYVDDAEALKECLENYNACAGAYAEAAEIAEVVQDYFFGNDPKNIIKGQNEKGEDVYVLASYNEEKLGTHEGHAENEIRYDFLQRNKQ